MANYEAADFEGALGPDLADVVAAAAGEPNVEPGHTQPWLMMARQAREAAETAAASKESEEARAAEEASEADAAAKRKVDLLHADGPFARHELNDLVHKQEWVAVRQHFLDREDIEDRFRLLEQARPAGRTGPHAFSIRAAHRRARRRHRREASGQRGNAED